MIRGDSAKRAEIDNNLIAFLAMLPALMRAHANGHVLMRQGAVIGYFLTALDAQIAGNQRFADRLFSIQRIQDIEEELGHFSHAVHPG